MLLWSGQLVSWIGTEVTGITLPLLVLAFSGSSALAGTLAAVRGAIYVLLALPAGALIDRWDRRRIMVLANVGSAVAMSSICVALFLGRLTIALLFIAGAAEGMCFVFANLARFTALRRVVPPEQFPAAVAQNSIADSTALLVGPPLGGFLYQLAGAGAAIAIDACSYVINACSIFFITTPLQETRERMPTTLVAEMRAGVVWLWRQRLLRHANLLMAGRFAVTSGLYLLVIVLARQEHAASAVIGAIFAVSAGAGILGAAAAGRLYQRFPARMLLLSTTGVTWILVTCYLLTAHIVLLAAVTAAIYAVNPFFELAMAGRAAVIIPDALRGRVISLMRLVELGAYALGFFAVGISLTALGSTATILLLSALLCVLTVFALLSPAFHAL